MSSDQSSERKKTDEKMDKDNHDETSEWHCDKSIHLTTTSTHTILESSSSSGTKKRS